MEKKIQWNNYLIQPLVPADIDTSKYHNILQHSSALTVKVAGQITQITGNLVKARIPNAKIGDLCVICTLNKKYISAQVVGFDDEEVYLTPIDRLEAVGPKTTIINCGDQLKVGVSDKLLGRVVDALGRPIDGLGEVPYQQFYPTYCQAPKVMQRSRINSPLPVGVRAVDLLLPVGEGQRLGVFSTAGVGKSSLLGMIARNSTADVNVVALVGERGREVRDFLAESLGEGLKKSVVVVSTSDETPLRRITAAYTAMAIAEYFRDQGQRVMLLMDSVTRFARAHREIALSLGELPARQGYPPSVFNALPEYFERAGKVEKGSITGFFTVLLSSEQIEDPLGEEMRAILDGHIYLSSRLAHHQHYPAIDILRSISRLSDQIASEKHQALMQRFKRLWSVYEENYDLINIGAYKKGSDAAIDEAIAMHAKLQQFLIQHKATYMNFQSTLDKAAEVLGL
ncbi:MAG: FliI/YscN family ATPase [Deltaproteobacteria bacterium]|nr:FliI/YscN family ATPase [Deltaproteobacteria bacterium]